MPFIKCARKNNLDLRAPCAVVFNRLRNTEWNNKSTSRKKGEPCGSPPCAAAMPPRRRRIESDDDEVISDSVREAEAVENELLLMAEQQAHRTARVAPAAKARAAASRQGHTSIDDDERMDGEPVEEQVGSAPTPSAPRSNRLFQTDLFGRRVPAAPRSAGACATSTSRTYDESASSARSAEDEVEVDDEDENLPELADHERERKSKHKGPTGPRGRAKLQRQTKQSNVSLAQRLNDFPGQSLKVSGFDLWCKCCKQSIPNLSESLKRHITTTKHKLNLKKLNESDRSDAGLLTDLADYFTSNPDELMVSLPPHTTLFCLELTMWRARLTLTLFRCSFQATVRTETHVLRYRTVEAFLASGTPLERLPFFRPLIERGEASLTDESHMSTYIPKIEQREMTLLKLEIDEQFISIAFDGTSRLGEAINLTGRWCDTEFNLINRLFRFMTSKLHVKAVQLASVITRVICSELAIAPDMVVSMARDSVSINGTTCRLLATVPFSNAENFLCISHTLNNVGIRLVFDVLVSFMTPWLELVGGRHPHAGARSLWRSAVSPQSVPGFSLTRWYSKAEIQFVLAENFDKLLPFLAKLDEYGYGDATRAKLHEILDDAAARSVLRLQLAAMLDLRFIVKTTYELEGDRLEVLLVYDRIEELRARGRAIMAKQSGSLPNVDSILRSTMKLRNGCQIQKVCCFHLPLTT